MKKNEEERRRMKKREQELALMALKIGEISDIDNEKFSTLKKLLFFSRSKKSHLLIFNPSGAKMRSN